CCACVAVRLAKTTQRIRVKMRTRLLLMSVFSSEDVLQRKLNLTRRTTGLSNFASLHITCSVAQERACCGKEKIRMIRQIEDFCAELNPLRLLHTKVLQDRKVDGRISWT